MLTRISLTASAVFFLNCLTFFLSAQSNLCHTILTPEGQSMPSCKTLQDFIPNQTDEILIVKLVFHIVQTEDSNNPNNFVQGNPGHEAHLAALFQALNTLFTSSEQMYCEGVYVNNSYITDSRIRFELVNTFYHQDNIGNVNDNSTSSNYNSNKFSPDCGDGVLDVFFCDNPNTIATGGNAFNGSILLFNLIEQYILTGGNPVADGHLLGHEIGHVLSLAHSFETKAMFNDICQDPDEPYNEFCETKTDPHCTNNFMGYNSDLDFISPLQMAAMRQSLLTGTGVQYLKLSAYNQTNNIYIQQSTTWNDERIISGDVHVEYPATLTINCTTIMVPGSRIIVKRGARLIVDNATLRTNSNIRFRCPSLENVKKWVGIEVWGNTSVASTLQMLDPDYIQNANDPGVVILNNATIENALVGIFAQQRGFPWSVQLQHFGGLISAVNTKFRSCRKGVEYISYFPVSVPSTFIGCRFWESNSLNDATSPCPPVEPDCDFAGLKLNQEGITSWQVSGLTISDDCDFKYLSNGIVVGDATIDVFGSKFRKIKNAVILGSTAPSLAQISNIGNTSGDGNQFEDCEIPLAARPYGTLNALHNSFKNSLKTGVSIEGGSIYALFENKFLKTNTTTTAIDGIELRNSAGPSTSSINCNEYVTSGSSNSFTNGVLVAYDNTATQILSNKFSSINDISLFGQPVLPPFWQGNPGALPDQGTPDNAVFNVFTASGSAHEAEIFTESPLLGSSQFFRYYVPSSDCSLLTLPKNPLYGPCKSAQAVYYFANQLAPTEGAPYCTFGIINGEIRPDPCQYPTCIDWYYVRIDSVDRLLNKGASSNLVTLLQTTSVQPTTIDSLNAASPYLSDEILYNVIHSNMGDAYRFTVLKNNIPLTPFIFNESSGILSTVEMDSLQLLQSNSTGGSRRDEARQYRILLNNSKMRLLKEYTDSLFLAGNLTDLETLLAADPERHSREALVGLKLRIGDFTGVAQLLSNYPTLNTDDSEFKFIQTLNLSLLQNEREWLPSSQDSTTLFQIAVGYSPQSGFAKTLIWVLYDSILLNELPQYASGRSVVSHDQTEEKYYPAQSENIRVYPNPTFDVITVEVFEFDAALKPNVEVFNLTGVVIERIPINNSKVQIKLGNLEKGIYFLRYTDDSGKRDEKLIVKTR